MGFDDEAPKDAHTETNSNNEDGASASYNYNEDGPHFSYTDSNNGEAVLKWEDAKKHYEILGLEIENSTLTSEKEVADAKKKVKKAYHILSKKKHPDKGGNNEEFQKINTAYNNVLIPALDKILEEIRSKEKDSGLRD